MVTEFALVFLTWAVSCWASWMIGFHQGMKERADGDAAMAAERGEGEVK